MLLGQLQPQPLGRQPRVAGRGRDVVGQFHPAQLAGREVDRDVRRPVVPRQHRDVLARALQHPLGDGKVQVAIGDHGQEVDR